jgi:GT2 family glycosyltransferase
MSNPVEIQRDEKPLLSLCMATCLRPDTFPESFAGLLAQTYSPLEIVILADGGHPDTVRILEGCSDPRVRWIMTEKPSGMVPAWNIVCREARGKYLLFCADDDVLLENAVDQQVMVLEKNPDVAFCHADFAFIDDSGRLLDVSKSLRGFFIDDGNRSLRKYVVQPRACMQTAVVRRKLWERVGGWDENAGNPGDNSLYLKLLRLGNVAHVPVIACNYRIRTKAPDSWQKKFRSMREDFALSTRYLALPPLNNDRVLLKEISARFTRRGMTLFASASNEEERIAIRVWLYANVFEFSRIGRFVGLLGKVNAWKLAEGIFFLEQRLRQRIKTLLLRILALRLQHQGGRM